MIMLCLSALAFLPFLDGERWNSIAFASSLIILGGTAVWCLVRCVRGTYNATVFRVFGYVAATASFEIEYFLGVFSPTTLVVTLGLTFIGMGMDRRHALAIPVYAISGYALLAALITAGVLHDPGVVHANSVPFVSKLFFVALAPLVLVLTLWMARVSRRTMADAMTAAADATRLAAQREALLAEAQEDLEQLLHAGAGRRGRFTGSSAGDYELQEIIGRGAMGEVYAARRAKDDQRAAIKLLRPETLVKANMLKRFLREGETAGSLTSPNVVRILGVGELADVPIPYIAMELLDGDDLAAILRKQHRLDRKAAVAMLHGIARGLDSAHGAGIIHRDLKPQNLFEHRPSAKAPGVWKILDFGVSKLASSQGTLTQQAVVGTPGYMSPEQARGADVTHLSDIFSLGAVAYRAITARPPFVGNDLPQKLFAIVYNQPPRPSALVDGLPRDVDGVLAIALAKDPKDRFDSANKFAAALDRGFSGKLKEEERRTAERILKGHPWGHAGQR